MGTKAADSMQHCELIVAGGILAAPARWLTARGRLIHSRPFLRKTIRHAHDPATTDHPGTHCAAEPPVRRPRCRCDEPLRRAQRRADQRSENRRGTRRLPRAKRDRAAESGEPAAPAHRERHQGRRPAARQSHPPCAGVVLRPTLLAGRTAPARHRGVQVLRTAQRPGAARRRPLRPVQLGAGSVAAGCRRLLQCAARPGSARLIKGRRNGGEAATGTGAATLRRGTGGDHGRAGFPGGVRQRRGQAHPGRRQSRHFLRESAQPDRQVLRRPGQAFQQAARGVSGTPG